ncbi:MAG TPA: hypothetical protein VGM50_14135 [Gemmatimonadaceae bacterium]|jgi:hypothetical protein
MAIRLPAQLMDSLPELRRQLDQARRELAQASANVKELSDLITAIEKAGGRGRTEHSAVLVVDGSFTGMRISDAARRVMLANPTTAFRVVQLTDVIVRGGMQGDVSKIRDAVSAFMKDARKRGELVQSATDPQAWLANEAGQVAWTAHLRQVQSSIERATPSLLSEFADEA